MICHVYSLFFYCSFVSLFFCTVPPYCFIVSPVCCHFGEIKVDIMCFCRYEIWSPTATTWSVMDSRQQNSVTETSRCWPNYTINISYCDRKKVTVFVFTASTVTTACSLDLLTLSLFISALALLVLRQERHPARKKFPTIPIKFTFVDHPWPS